MNNRFRWYPIVITACAAAASIFAYDKLPSRVPTHWNLRGGLDAYSSPLVAAVAMPLLMLGIAILAPLLPRIDPRRANYDRFFSSYYVAIDAALTVFLVAHCAMLAAALGHAVPIDRVFPAALVVLFIILGNVLPRVRSNFWFGIRTPWTLSSDRVWERAHRVHHLFIRGMETGERIVMSVALPFMALVGTVAAQAPATRSFAVMHDADTLATERITRTAGRVDSDFLDKTQGIRIALAMTLGPGALVTRAEITVRMATAAPDGPPLQHVTLAFEPDSVLVSMGADGAAPGQRVPVPHGALPFLNLSVATAEQLFMRAKAVGGATAQVPIFSIVGGKTANATVRWSGADSAVLSLAGADLRARLTPFGEIIDAAVPEQRVRFMSASAHVTGDATVATTPPPPKPDYSAPPGAPYVAEKVRVRNQRAGIDLAGTLTTPGHAAGVRVPAVVMITGSGAQDRDEATPAIPGWRPFRQIADALGRRGIAVLRMDDRGVGGSSSGPSGATSADFADDIRAALTFLRARQDIDPSRLALIGHSEGGIIAPMIAATDQAVHAIVIVAAPSRTGRAVSDQQVRAAFVAKGLTGARLDSEIAANDRMRDAQVAANPWLGFWFAYDPIPTAKRVTQPVLIVQGATDSQVSPDQAQELAAAFRSGGNRHVTVRVLPEINHLMVHDPNGAFTAYGKLESLSVSPVVLTELGDWLVKHLR